VREYLFPSENACATLCCRARIIGHCVEKFG
jgi:hypothetical protein